MNHNIGPDVCFDPKVVAALRTLVERDRALTQVEELIARVDIPKALRKLSCLYEMSNDADLTEIGERDRDREDHYTYLRELILGLRGNGTEVQQNALEELSWIVSYLAHYDQDANHAWMVRRIRAILAGKDPGSVIGWVETDGVRPPRRDVQPIDTKVLDLN